MSKLIVIDLSNYIYRAFYAITPLNAPDGTPVNAVYGVLGMVHNLITKYQPTHIIVARDSFSDESLRKAIYPEYKANRSETPKPLSPQFPLVKEMINALGMVQVQVSQYEADDVIGSVVTQWKYKFDEILIATGDKDLLQFVGENVKVIDTLKNVTYDREEVKKKMGVYPERIEDYLSLVGDASDNVPGVNGIGPKGAAKLIEAHGALDNIYNMLESGAITGKLADTLSTQKDVAYLSRSLVRIYDDLPLPSIDLCEYELYSTPELEAFFDRLDFKSWKGRF